MYPTHAAVLQIVPTETDAADPEAFRHAARNAIESWAKDTSCISQFDQSSPEPGDLRVIDSALDQRFKVEIREIGPIGDIPWAWQGVIRRPLPCPAFPKVERCLESHLEMRTAVPDEHDAPTVKDVGFKLVLRWREQLVFPASGRSPGNAAELAPPSTLLDELVSRFRVYQGTIQWTKTYGRIHDDRTIDRLYEDIVNPRRTVPLVVTVGTKTSESPISPEALGPRLFGIARVLHVENPQLTDRIRKDLGERLRIAWGAVRLYRSSLQRYDDAASHPFFLGREIDKWRLIDFVDHLSNLIRRGEIPLVDNDEIVLEAFRRIGDRSARENRNSIEQALEVLRGAVGGSTVESLAEDIRTLTKLYEEQREARELAESDRLAVARQLEEARKVSHDLRTRIQVLEAGLAAPSQQVLHDVSLWPEPTTLADAIEQAMQLVVDEIVILDDVRKSIHKVHGISPLVLREKLDIVRRVVGACRAGQGDGRGPADYFGEHGIELKADISETAKQRYRSDYVVRYNDSLGDHEVVMGPHIDLSERHRIYWHHDKANQRFVIGHIGGHLRDKSTR